jgi:hypothetical protein
MPGRRLSLPRLRLGFLADRRAGIGMMAAIAIPVLLGVASLVGEYGHSLLIKTDDQRIADLAAYAGALAYNTNNTTASMTSAAQAVAALNGVASSSVAAALVASPTGDGNQSVQVTISSNMPLYLAEILGAKTSLPVSSVAYAEIKAAGSACIIALNSSGTGVTLSGGTSVTANQCAVASNVSVVAPCGTSVTTPTIDYNASTAPSAGCSGGIRNASGGATTLIKTVTADPLASNSGVSAATARLGTVAAMTSPTAPAAPSVTSGYAWNFDWNGNEVTTLRAMGCTASWANSTYTVNCPAGTYNITSVTAGPTVNITTTGTPTFNFASAVTLDGTVSLGAGNYNFAQTVSIPYGAVSFGAGNYNFTQGLSVSGGATVTFGAGAFRFGGGGCAGATYSICNSANLTFGGPSTFAASSGIYNGGGSTLAMGSGSTNSYQIGASSTGNAMYLLGGSTTTLADATGASSVFQLNGTVNASAGGGSCLVLPAAAQHDINGALNVAGGVVFGAGVYTVNGYMAAGATSGGGSPCNGQTVALSGTNVTFVLSGASTATGGCSGQVFCVTAGYSNISLTAPNSGTYNDLLVVGPTSGSVGTAGALFAAGAAGTTMSGAFYFPKGPISLSGGAGLTYGAGGCLQIIGSAVNLTGGASTASDCTGLGNTGTASVALVQ